MARIVVVGSHPRSLTVFRLRLIADLVDAGHEVTAMSADAPDAVITQLGAVGAAFRSFPVQRTGVDPRQDLVTLRALRAAFAAIRPDIVLAYTIKPVIWAGIALRDFPGVSFYALVTGLGHTLRGAGPRARLLRFVTSRLYARALRRATRVIFQNQDDRHTFVSRRIIDEALTEVVSGSGVDLTHFSAQQLAPGPPRFLCIARLLKSKGIREYAEAARGVRQKCPEATFQLIGPADPSPDAIAAPELRRWIEDGSLTYLGEQDDVRSFLSACHVYVLPSYHEGIPRTVLEAMATARAILTTNVAGCRDTVVGGENGFLVPPRNAIALAQRMEWFIDNQSAWGRMGLCSRSIAEARFDVGIVNREMFRIMQLSPSPESVVSRTT